MKVTCHVKLSEDDLLSRCLDGKTQNQNEAVNGMFWDHIPKGVFVGAEVLQLGIYDVVANFNIGSQACIKVSDKLGISLGEYCMNDCEQSDKMQVVKANYKKRPENKTRRLLQGKRGEN